MLFHEFHFLHLFSYFSTYFMTTVLIFTCVDPSLGKVDKHSLSQQTLMELFIENITTNKERICGSNDTPKDLSAWNGLVFNKTKEIEEIDWSKQGLKGNIPLKWLPLSLKRLRVSTNQLEGTVDLTCLPDGFDYLSLMNNRFSGTIDLTQLPPEMTQIFLQMNNFCGKTDFSQLPKSLVWLNVSYTDLEGEVVAFEGTLRNHKSNVKMR